MTKASQPDAKLSAMQVALCFAYFAVLLLLAMYGIHRSHLVLTCLRYAKKLRTLRDGAPRLALDRDPATLPHVTIQLPLYNEATVVARLLEQTAKMAYPREKLEIQVLDDSTDESRQMARAKVMDLCGEPPPAFEGTRADWDGELDMVYIHRVDRTGYKAGALDEGLRVAKGELVAIFDADFVPGETFLLDLVPHFIGEENKKVGMVQARWGHMNRDVSWLTRVQALMLDGHHLVENRARHAAGWLFNFSGTGGMWRKEAIATSGGWQHDTLTEDLDLSYRAQLLGWKFVFLPGLVAPAEVPVEMNAFKSQQHRWAKGSIQVCLKLLPQILRSDLPFGVKAEAFLHLTANFNYLLMSALSILMFPSMVIRYNMGWYEMLLIDVPLFFAATASVANFYVVSQRELYPDWKTRLRYVPFLMSVGIGLAVNNTRAVLEALFHHETAFARTPKYGIERGSDQWAGKKYQQAVAVQPLVEIGLGLYFTMTVFYALANGIYGSLPFLVLFQAGFLYMGLTSVIQQSGGGEGVLNAQVARGK